MTSAFKSQFGSGTDVGSPFPESPPSHGHGFLHNLLEDAINTAKGLPMGVKMGVEHPIRSVKLMGKSYAQEYSPLIHGDFSKFYHEFHAHPLQPLLDVVSAATVVFGGAGAGIKAADSLTQFGDVAAREAAGVAGEQGTRPLTRLANRFRPYQEHTMKVHESSVGYDLVQHYSTNMFTRALQRGFGGTSHKLADLIKLPENVRKPARLEQQELSRRRYATQYITRQQQRAGMGAAAKGATRDDIETTLRNSMISSMLEEGFIKVPAEKMKDLESLGGNYRWATAKNVGLDEHGPHQGMLDLGPAGYAEPKHGGLDIRKVSLQSTSDADIAKYIEDLGATFQGTTKVNKAFLDEHGNGYLFRKSVPQEIRNEIEGTQQLFNRIGRKPTTIWKYLILAQAPRYFVNNVVGNATMLAMATHPVALTRGLLYAIRTARGAGAEDVARGEMMTIAEQEINRWLPQDVVARQFGHLHHTATGIEQFGHTPLAKMGRRTQKVAGAGFDITGKVAYSATQRVGLMAALRAEPEVRRLMSLYRSRGVEKYTAFQRAAREATRDRAVAARVEKNVTDWAGQYYHLNSLEKMVTALVPFYNWDRHALRFAKTQVLERPVQSAVLAQIGSQGDTAADKALGKIPDFLKGAIPVKGKAGGVLGFILGGDLPGRKKVILTSGLNPLAAAAEDVHAIAALVGARSPGEAVGGQINPLLSGAIAGVTGQRLFSGSKVHDRGGVIGTAVSETFGTLPQARLIKNLIEGNQPTYTVRKGSHKKTPHLYTKDTRQLLSSLLGLSERDVSPEAAKALYDKQHGVKKGRRKKKQETKEFVSALKSNF